MLYIVLTAVIFGGLWIVILFGEGNNARTAGVLLVLIALGVKGWVYPGLVPRVAEKDHLQRGIPYYVHSADTVNGKSYGFLSKFYGEKDDKPFLIEGTFESGKCVVVQKIDDTRHTRHADCPSR